MTNDCKTCPVSTGTHKPAEALHQQIAEPQPTALGYADAISAGLSYTAPHILALAADELRAQHARIEDIEAQHREELRAYEITVANREARIAELEAQLDAIGAGGVEPLRKPAAAPQAVQATVPLPLLVRDIARDLGITVPQACNALKPLGNYSTNSAVTGEMARMLHDHFPAPAHPAGGVPAQASEWDGKLPERLQSVLNALRLELPAAVVNDVEFEVRSHYEAMHTSLSTSRRMYGAARDRLEAIDAAQPDPFAATQPAAQGMEALGAHEHQERSA